MMVVFFFFFQAEDGIRDVAVTGVQTCALPISTHSSRSSVRFCRRCATSSRRSSDGASLRTISTPGPPLASESFARSEEHTSELQSRLHLVCRLLLEKKKTHPNYTRYSVFTHRFSLYSHHAKV